jgi:hypothetical protein
MNKLKLIATSLLMASMLTTASFSMQAAGQAPDAFVVDQSYPLTLTCAFEQSQTRQTPEQYSLELARLTLEVQDSERTQNPKYSWMRGQDRNEFDRLMSRDGQIGGRGWNDIADKLAATQNWLANKEIEARYAVLYKDITETNEVMMGSTYVSLRPAKYSILSSGDISELNSLLAPRSTTDLETKEKLNIAQQWWDYVQDKYMELDTLISVCTGKTATWMTEEDHTAFANARTQSTGAGMDSISDMYIAQKSVTVKVAAYTKWHTNRHQFRTDTIALEQFAANLSEAEQAAFNTAKATCSMTNSISDMYHGTKSPTEKLAIYTKWLEAYRAAQANA